MSNNILQLVRAIGVSRPITPTERRSILIRAQMGATNRHLAREYGVQERVIEDVLLEQFEIEKEAARRQGFSDGRRSLLTRPYVAQRRAA